MFKKIIALIFASLLFIPSLSLAGFGDDGIKCVTPGSWYVVSWDNKTSSYTPTIQAGTDWGYGWSCMGMCGAGCNNLRKGDYTIDCLEHDLCGVRMRSAPEGIDAHCGDEYKDAMGDWFGAAFGCRARHL